jgi:hypothetical protein
MQKNINIHVQFKYWYDYSIVTTKKKDDTWDTCIFSWFVIGGSYGLHVSSVTCYVLDMHIFLLKQLKICVYFWKDVVFCVYFSKDIVFCVYFSEYIVFCVYFWEDIYFVSISHVIEMHRMSLFLACNTHEFWFQIFITLFSAHMANELFPSLGIHCLSVPCPFNISTMLIFSHKTVQPSRTKLGLSLYRDN